MSHRLYYFFSDCVMMFVFQCDVPPVFFVNALKIEKARKKKSFSGERRVRKAETTQFKQGNGLNGVIVSSTVRDSGGYFIL